MAQHKQLISLFSLCLNAISLMVDSACNTIAQKYRNWNAAECKNAICGIQEFVTLLPGCLSDKLHECINEDYEFDIRIRLAVYMHCNMKILQFHKTYMKMSLYLDDVFWKTKLSCVNKIVSLQLFTICSDSILEVIGKYCLSLEYIQFILPYSGSYSCIKGFSDFGLAQLENCKSLKLISLKHRFDIGTSPKLEHACQRLEHWPVSTNAIIQLLRNLPSLEILPCSSTICAIPHLPSDVKSLNLRSIIISVARVFFILPLCKLCIRLEKLSLTFIQLGSEFDCSEVFTIITNSALQVSSLSLMYICKCDSLFNLISEKGKFLDTLILHIRDISGELVHAIGLCCPKLRHLTLAQTPLRNPCLVDDGTFVSDEVMFTKLEILHLSGFILNRKFVVRQVLLNSKSLKDLHLTVNLYRMGDEDEVLNDIFKRNPLRELRRVHIMNHLKFNTYLYLLHLPNMHEMTFLMHRGLTSLDIIRLQNEIKNNNLGIVLNFLTMGIP